MRDASSTHIPLHCIWEVPTKVAVLCVIVSSGGCCCCWGGVGQRRERIARHAQVVVDHAQPVAVPAAATAAATATVRPPAGGRRMWRAPDLTASLSMQNPVLIAEQHTWQIAASGSHAPQVLLVDTC